MFVRTESLSSMDASQGSKQAQSPTFRTLLLSLVLNRMALYVSLLLYTGLHITILARLPLLRSLDDENNAAYHRPVLNTLCG